MEWQLVDSHKSVLASRSTLNRHNSSHCSRRRHRNSHHIPSPNHPQLKRRLTDNHSHSHSRSNHHHNSCHRHSNRIRQVKLLLAWVIDIGKQEELVVADKWAKESDNMVIIVKSVEAGAEVVPELEI